jgi:rod shape-determining protein MreC
VPRASRFGTRFDILLFGAMLLLGFLARTVPAEMREPVAAALRQTVLVPLVELQRGAVVRRAAYLTYRDSVTVRDSVSLLAMNATALEAENDRLRRLLGLGSQLRWGFVPAEALRLRQEGEPWTLTLSAGSSAGVQRFSPVVAPEGLVGMVQRVDPTISQAILWTNPDFRVSAMAADGSAFGIVQAHLGDADEEGPDRYLMEMRGIPFRSTLKPGTVVVSSGLGSTYPRGIPIGTVLRELRTAEGWARTYLLRPAVLPPHTSSVMILKPSRAEAGVEPVWASTIAAETAAERVAAAGDSVARRDSARRAAPASAPSTPGESGAAAPRPAATAGAAPAPAAAPTDSARRAAARAAARRDSVRRDSVRRDSVRRDAARQDSIRRESARRDSAARAAASRDTARRDSVRADSVTPPAPPLPRLTPPRADTPRVDSTRPVAASSDSATGAPPR